MGLVILASGCAKCYTSGCRPPYDQANIDVVVNNSATLYISDRQSTCQTIAAFITKSTSNASFVSNGSAQCQVKWDTSGY